LKPAERDRLQSRPQIRSVNHAAAARAVGAGTGHGKAHQAWACARIWNGFPRFRILSAAARCPCDMKTFRKKSGRDQKTNSINYCNMILEHSLGFGNEKLRPAVRSTGRKTGRNSCWLQYEFHSTGCNCGWCTGAQSVSLHARRQYRRNSKDEPATNHC